MENRWVWKTLLWTSKENSSPKHCANRIFACVREIKKRLEVFLHSLSLPPSPLSLYLVLAVSRRLLVQRAGRYGCRGDAAVRQGLQQTQGPQHPLTPGPPPGHGLPHTYRVSTVAATALEPGFPAWVNPSTPPAMQLDNRVLLTSC